MANFNQLTIHLVVPNPTAKQVLDLLSSAPKGTVSYLSTPTHNIAVYKRDGIHVKYKTPCVLYGIATRRKGTTEWENELQFSLLRNTAPGSFENYLLGACTALKIS